MRTGVILCFLLFFSACNNDEAEFPEVVTHDAQQIGSTSAVIEAEIRETGTIRPIQFGFIWGNSSGLNFLNAPVRLDLGATSSKREFSVKLESLSPSTQYFVRSFTSNSDYSKIYYGNEIEFTTLP